MELLGRRGAPSGQLAPGFERFTHALGPGGRWEGTLVEELDALIELSRPVAKRLEDAAQGDEAFVLALEQKTLRGEPYL